MTSEYVPQRRVLIVEDKSSLAALYRNHIETEGHGCVLAGTLQAAETLLQTAPACAVLLSLEATSADVTAVLDKWHLAYPSTRIIVVAANASISDAVVAVRAGAWDYLVKPISRNRLITTLNTAFAATAPAYKTQDRPSADADNAWSAMLGTSAAMLEVKKRIEAIAASSAPAFICGESGTGKELCARAVHNLSPRKDQPFIALNCGAIPRDLMESEIFGHLKGSFTGAISDREGAAAAAHRGTLFLDEVCEMEPVLQIKLLRFLQTGTIQPVGSTHTKKVDIRVICATNKQPEAEISAGRFRQDLYFRLHVLPIEMPPLRLRAGDIRLLAYSFLRQFSAEESKNFRTIDDQALDLIETYNWPGNIRELQNIIRQAVVLHDAHELTPDMLLLQPAKTAQAERPVVTKHRLLWQIERDVIEDTISRCAGSIPKAASMLGISPSTIYRKRESWQSHCA